MSKLTRIVALVVDVTEATLYRQDGEIIIIKQGDARLRKVIDDAAPQLIKQGWADVDLTKPHEENSFAKFEEQNKGGIRFFRVAKAVLKSIFGDPKVSDLVAEEESNKPLPPMSIGVPVTQYTNTTTKIYDVSEKDEVDAVAEDMNKVVDDLNKVSAQVTKTMSAVDEIMKHAVPVTDPNYHEESVAVQGNITEDNNNTVKTPTDIHDDEIKPDTIIAVVDNKVIPGVELIKSQFAHATKMGSTIGVENFLKRISTVIDNRRHSIDDLLKFMERADMPIADDGSIIIYKVLKFKGDRTNGKYVDCHTKKVDQWTGAYVCMDESLVDTNRRNECSNGLHVARRGYIRSFSGDVCVLAKLAPEDVIAVPEYDANKMRVCGYHILMQLTEEQYSLLKANKPITDDPKGKIMLANAISGNHVHRTHEIRITEQNGGGVTVKKLTEVFPDKVKPTNKVVEALQNPQEVMKAPTLDPKEISKETSQKTRKEVVQELYNEFMAGDKEAMVKLLSIKKAAKVGWDKLGIPDPTQAKPKVKRSKEKGKAKSLKGKAEPKTKIDFKPKPITTPSVFQETPSEGSPRERIKKLLAIGTMNQQTADAVYAIKKKAKKSWGDLGVPADVVAKITAHMTKV